VCGSRHPDRLDEGAVGVRRKGNGDGSTGVVIMDHVGEGGDWDLVRLVVEMNMGVMMKMRGQM
jgi:1-phosphatidylinositol phosphodiesterase